MTDPVERLRELFAALSAMNIGKDMAAVGREEGAVQHYFDQLFELRAIAAELEAKDKRVRGVAKYMRDMQGGLIHPKNQVNMNYYHLLELANALDPSEEDIHDSTPAVPNPCKRCSHAKRRHSMNGPCMAVENEKEHLYCPCRGYLPSEEDESG